MTAEGREQMTPEGWWLCCDHCRCGTPEGVWPDRSGHDDTCAKGCNDGQADRA